MSKQNEPPIIVEVQGAVKQEDLEKFKKELTEALKTANQPAPKPTALNEAATPKTEDYKPKLAELIKHKRKISYSLGINDATPQDQKELCEAYGALSGGSAIPQIWAAEVERLHIYPNSKFLSTPGLVNWKDDITGNPGNQVHVPTVEKVVAVDVTEGTEPTINAATVSSVPISLKTIGAGYYMSKADTEDLLPGAIDALNAGLGTGIAEKVDADFLAWLAAPKAATRGTLDLTGATPTTLRGSYIAASIGSLRAATYEPAFLIVHPLQMVSLLKDAAFYDASQFGSAEVTQRGAVANYFGVDLIQTPLVYSTGATYKAFLLAKGAICGAIKRRPEINTDYIIESGRNYVRMDMRFGGTIVHPDGVFEIKTKSDG